jgi:hypothetical protein
MQQQSNYTAPSHIAKVAASSQRLVRGLMSTGNPGLFVAVLAKPQEVSGRFDTPDVTTGLVATGLPTTFAVMGVSGVPDTVVWCPSKILDPVDTQRGTIATMVRAVPEVHCGFNVDVSLLRSLVGQSESATSFAVNMSVATPTATVDESPIYHTYRGIMTVPASSSGETLYCERIQWLDLMPDDHTHRGWDNVLRPQFASSPNGVIPSIHALTFEFSPVTGQPVPIHNIAFVAIRLTFCI